MGHNKSKAAGISEKVIRLLDIYSLMAKDSFPSIELLKDRLEVSERSVYRYLEIINMLDPIEYDSERKGYKFTGVNRIKKLTASKEDFILLLTVGEMVSHLGTSFKDSFAKFKDKFLSAARRPSVRDHLVLVKMTDAFEPEKFQDFFKTVLECASDMRSIDIVYKTRSRKEIKERRVDPYGIVFYGGAWILIGYCHLRKSIRRFSLDMIMEMKETWRSFKLPEGFTFEGHLAQSWGIYDEDPVDVTIRFSPNVADYIVRRPKWHSSEKRKVLPSGELDLTFTVAGVKEIKKWIYAWIPDVQIIEPGWFKEMANAEIRQVLEKQRGSIPLMNGKSRS